jgi:hypothetical protein
MKQGQQVRGGSDAKRLRKPVGGGRSGMGIPVTFVCRCPGRGDAEGEETSREEPEPKPAASVASRGKGRSVSGVL